MGNKQVRIGQLIAPFGPGSIYTDRYGTPHVICGLDGWFKSFNSVKCVVPCDQLAEFERTEPRLSAILGVRHFRIPPDYRHVSRGMRAPPNAGLFVPAHRFPRWYRHTRTGEMRRFNLDSSRIEGPKDGGRWQPVRFVSVCEGGHLCEFPWKQWIGCNCAGDGKLKLIDRGGPDLSTIRISCSSCPEDSSGHKGRTLAGMTSRPDTAKGEESAFERLGISCPGDRPWLGEGADEKGCPYPLVGALINQTNLYFPRTTSAISLPDFRPMSQQAAALMPAVNLQPTFGIASDLWRMDHRAEAVAMLKAGLKSGDIQCEDETLEEVLAGLFDQTPCAMTDGTNPPTDPEPELLTLRRDEFNIIRNEVEDSETFPDLRVIHTDVPEPLSPWFSRVRIVEKLKEARVFFGFDRLEPNNHPLTGMPDTAMRQLFREPPERPEKQWLPMVEVFGEGIYIELNEQRLTDWQNIHAARIAGRLSDDFLERLYNISQALPPLKPGRRDWALRYLMIHSLAHILINQLVFECGYSTAALRERLYISIDTASPMAAILIYTASGDSDGTLGGLARLGRPEKFEPVVRRALHRAAWCSADPVCSENLGGQGSRLTNLAACHACILLPETSCETINHGLDRAMVVGTPADRTFGFLSELLDSPDTAL